MGPGLRSPSTVDPILVHGTRADKAFKSWGSTSRPIHELDGEPNRDLKSVTMPDGQDFSSASHATFDPKVTRTGVQGFEHAFHRRDRDYSRAAGQGCRQNVTLTRSTSTGLQPKPQASILVGFYLPGDADGNGVVHAGRPERDQVRDEYNDQRHQ